MKKINKNKLNSIIFACFLKFIFIYRINKFIIFK